MSIFSDNAFARKRKITINADNDAKIYVDGKLVSSGTAKVIVGDNSTLNVRIEKTGFITAERNYINNEKNELPATDFVKLEVDDAYENSFTTDLANRDIDLKQKKNEEARKLINRIVASQFDVIEVTDKTTGYLRTASDSEKFKSATIRTRLIIKSGNSSNLAFKVKLVSEIGSVNASSRDDESFKSWDRLLRSFENIIQELQSRLGK
ncbi:MAG: hypothetical protein IPF62_05885 [Bacteroidetes bacterium]|nr:hypothetical protein [Bacteroidota bacterium]